MNIKFANPVKGKNNSSSHRVVNYLEKENEYKQDKTLFFNSERDNCNKYEVINRIDQNAKGQGLGKDTDKFISIIISPSQKELEHIQNDPEKLKEYIRDTMKSYAENFNKGLTEKDLVWYGKIEHNRSYGYQDEAVKKGEAIKGELKEGNQMHAHIIVSRCKAKENINVIGQHNDQERTAKISPLGNNKNDFSRDNFIDKCEQQFDNKFGYERDLGESYKYCNDVKNHNSKNIKQAESIHQSRQEERKQEQTIKQNQNQNQEITL